MSTKTESKLTLNTYKRNLPQVHLAVFLLFISTPLLCYALGGDPAVNQSPAESLLWIQLGIFVMCSAFFSCSETAIFYLSKIQIMKIENSKKLGSESLLNLIKNPKATLNTILLGNLFVNIGASITFGMIVEKHIPGEPLLSFLAGAIGITLILLFFGEIMPKTIGYEKAETFAHILSPIVRIIYIILYPINYILMNIITIFFKIVGIPPEDSHTTLTEEELKSLLHLSDVKAVLEDDEKEMIASVMEFGEKTAEDIMTPRTEITGFPIDTPRSEIESYIKSKGHTRVVIYEEDLDHIVGILISKHVILNQEKSIKELIRPAHFIAPKKSISDLLNELRVSKMHLAIIVDEFGGTAGLLTLNDVIREIVGEIRDKTRTHQNSEIFDIQKTGKEDIYILNGKTEITEFEDFFDISLPEDLGRTINGIIINTIGKPPKENEKVEFNFGTFIIDKMEENRIDKLTFICKDKKQNEEDND